MGTSKHNSQDQLHFQPCKDGALRICSATTRKKKAKLILHIKSVIEGHYNPIFPKLFSTRLNMYIVRQPIPTKSYKSVISKVLQSVFG